MKYYRTGLKIPQSGIYKVTHSRHRLPHEVTLIAGELFPRCAACGDAVQFQLLAPAVDLDKSEFRVVVYELPEAA
ncbi:MAG: YjzC family protein [Acidobacteriales bacterium]|nr:YjzC family protein [Terriglobales bacterium]